MMEEEGAQQSSDANADKKSFGKDVGKLVSGTVVAQAVALCLTPFITRIFSPEIYGVASVFISIVSIITVIACMRYELAILLPKDDKDAGAIFLLCLMILVCVSLICIPVMFFCGNLIADLLGNAAIKDYLFLVPIAVFIDGLYLALRYWNTRRKRFGTQATTQGLQSISASGLKLGFGSMGFVVPGSLILGGILGHGLGMLILLGQAVRQDFGLIKGSFSFGNIKKQMVRYKKFPIFNTGGAFLNVISWQIPVFMLTAFFSSTICGLYTLGMMMIQLPMSLIGSSISQVYLQRASIAKHNNTLPSLVRDTASTLIILSILPFVLLSIIGGDLFGIVFGSEWVEAGVYVQILGIWAMVWFVTSTLGPTTVILEKQEVNLIFNIIIVSSRFVALLIGGMYNNVNLALFLFMISGIIIYGYIGCVYIFVWSKVSLKDILDIVKNPILISIGIGIFVLILSLTPVSPFVICSVAIFAGIGYIIYIFSTQPLIKSFLGR